MDEGFDETDELGWLKSDLTRMVRLLRKTRTTKTSAAYGLLTTEGQLLQADIPSPRYLVLGVDSAQQYLETDALRRHLPTSVYELVLAGVRRACHTRTAVEVNCAVPMVDGLGWFRLSLTPTEHAHVAGVTAQRLDPAKAATAAQGHHDDDPSPGNGAGRHAPATRMLWATKLVTRRRGRRRGAKNVA